MSKKPRGRPRLAELEHHPFKTRTEIRDAEFRNCDADDCPNIVSVADRPGYSGPVYCLLHREPVGVK